MDKIVVHPEIGSIHLKKVPGVSAIRISVHPRRGVVVTMPWLTRYPVAMRFVEKNRDWIIRKQEMQRRKFDRAIEQGWTIPTPGDGVTVSTLKRTIRFEQSPELVLFQGEIPVAKKSRVTSTRRRTLEQTAPIITIRSKGDETVITFPADFPAKPDRESPEGVLLSSALQKILRKEAKEVLPRKLEELAGKFGFEYNRLAIKNNLTNWGSCSAKRNINLNLHLVRLPEELIDYVILHELCHLEHMNHGDEFHALLDNLCGGREKELSRELRKYRLY